MNLAHRTRGAAVVLIPMIAAAIWAGLSTTPVVVTRLRWRDEGLRLVSPPTDPEVPAFSPAIARRQAGRYAWPLALGAVLVLVGLTTGTVSIARGARPSRRVRSLALRAGLLALLVGIAASALLVANDIVVERELGYGLHRVPSDLTSTPWGPTGVALAGVALGLLGCVETWTLHLIERIRGRSSTPPRGDLS